MTVPIAVSTLIFFGDAVFPFEIAYLVFCMSKLSGVNRLKIVFF
jgi:hypothetical protein